jgi:hypothetical protein
MHRIFLALLVCLPLAAQVKITQGTDKVSVEIDGKPFTEFFYGEGVKHPYLAPLRAASGTIVTRQFPMATVEGESHDHPHHRGLWVAHSDVNGYDFWNNGPEPSYAKMPKRGVIVLKRVENITSGKTSGSMQVTMAWVADGQTILTEKRKMTFYAGKENRVMDFDIMLTAVTKVTFGDEKDGMFAIRMAAGLEEKDKKSLPNPPRTGVMVNAEGLKGEKAAWGKRSPWMDYSGELNGEKVGVAILDNPLNPRFPTYWHSRAYGLFAANVFGVKAFENDPAKDGSMTLEPGQPVRFRYRVIIHPGDAVSAGIAGEWATYGKR